MIFLNSLFGYLCIAIIYKWLSAKTTDLYHVMIYMFLSPGGGQGGRSWVGGRGGGRVSGRVGFTTNNVASPGG